jgi:segregation and condensation protein A
MSFVVDLNVFRGPLDLLLYLVRKHELDVLDIPIALITDQFLQYLEVLQELNVNDVGEFLDMASALIEIKSRLVLPQGGEGTEEIEDPREELVQRLLEYKKFRDAASILEEQSRHWQKHLPRLANDLPPRRVDLAGQPLQEVELWDLVSAFGRIVRDSQTPQPSNIVYDDTPIHVYIQLLHERLLHNGRTSFSETFYPAMPKAAMIGVFLAILELVRHHSVRTSQEGLHGEIWILPGDAFEDTLDLSQVDTYDQPAPAAPTA